MCEPQAQRKNGMDPIEEIKARLGKYSNAKYKIDSSSITVLPISDVGFTVAFDVAHDRYIVSFNGWHEDFRNADEALNCFAFGLSDECRLKEYRRGEFAYRWIVESKDNGEWVEDSETGLFLFPFWKRTKVVYLQNSLITMSEKPSS
jgi:hypothetical protein